MVPIRMWLGLALVGLLTLGWPAAAQAPAEILGVWHGTLTPPRSAGVTVVLTVGQKPDGALTASFSQPYSGANAEAEVSSIAVMDGTLTFAIARANASFEGKWDPTGRKWAGTFKQSSLAMPLTLEAGKPPSRPIVAGLDGVWQGSIERGAAKLRLVLRIATAGYGTVVVLDSPDQLSYGQEIPVLSRAGNTVQLGDPAAMLEYSAKLSDDLSQMTGVWKRAGQPDATVTFARAATPVARFSSDRPQTPKPPFAYRVEDVAFDNPFEKGIRLAGTLTLPTGNGPFPAAVLIPGSGGSDRDDTTLGHKPFAVIADHLTKHGFAVLRFDSRGFGKSTGDYSAATDMDLATDANSAVRYLLGRPEIRRNAVGLIGHSEGGVIAPLAAASNKDVAFLVMLAGPGTRWDDVLRAQRRLIGQAQGKSNQDLDRIGPQVDAIYRAIAHSTSERAGIAAVRPLLTAEAMTALGVTGQDKDAVARQLNNHWTRYLLHYDPVATLGKIRVPVLAMGGSLDLQVPSNENLPAIRSALARDRDVTIKQIPNLNHMFQTAKTGAPGEYADIEETFAPRALDELTAWLTKRFIKQ